MYQSMDLDNVRIHSEIVDENGGFDKAEADNTFALELQKIIQQETGQSKDPNHDVLAEALATVDVDLPDVSNMSSPGLVYATEKRTEAPITDNKNSDLTVEHILGDSQVGNEEDDVFTKKLNSLLCDTNDIKRRYEEDTEHQQSSNKKQKSVYETLSPPESVSPLSDKSETQQGKESNTEKDYLLLRRKVASPKFLKQAPLPPPLTNEFTMRQVSEMKKRIINTHKLILNFNFLKDGYARTCEELSKTVIKLKDSEFDRARLVKENQDLKKLVLQLSKQLAEGK